MNTAAGDSTPSNLRSKPTPTRRGGPVTVVRAADETQIKPTSNQTRPTGPFQPGANEKAPRTKEEPGSRIARRQAKEANRVEAVDFQSRDAARRSSFKPGRAERIAGLQRPGKTPRGEGGFIAAPGRRPVKTFAGTRPIPKAAGLSKVTKAVGGDIVTEAVIGAGISYLTGEANNPVEAVVSAAGGAITSDNTGGADIKVINGVTYHYDPASNRLRDVDTGKEMGLAMKGGQEVAVPYGSAAGKKGTGQMIKEGITQTAAAIRDTAVTRRQAEVKTTGMTSGRGAGRATFTAPKPKPAVVPPSPSRKAAVDRAQARYKAKPKPKRGSGMR